MTRERLDRLLARAAAMIPELEWADFPQIVDGGVTRAMFVEMFRTPDFPAEVLLRLAAVRRIPDAELAGLPEGHHEDDQEAIGLLGAAIKRMVMDHHAPGDVDLSPLLIRVKIRSMDMPSMQAPPGARVPSYAAQQRLRAMGLPAIDLPDLNPPKGPTQ